MSVSCQCCVFSSNSLCDGPIPRPEASYRVCVSMSVSRCNSNPGHLNESTEIRIRQKDINTGITCIFNICTSVFASQDSIVGIVTKLRAGPPGIVVRFLARDRRFISSPKRSYRL
jgi:hypothetical protein